MNDGSDYAERLKKLLGLALNKQEEILTYQPKRPGPRMFNTQAKVAHDVEQLAMAVGSADLKRKATDGLVKLLNEIRKYQSDAKPKKRKAKP